MTPSFCEHFDERTSESHRSSSRWQRSLESLIYHQQYLLSGSSQKIGLGPTAQFGENPVYRISKVVGSFNSISLPPLSSRSVPLTSASSLLFLSFIKCLWSGGLLFFFFPGFENSFRLVDFRTASALNFSLLFWINTVLQVFFFPFHFGGPTTVLFYITFSFQNCLKMELMPRTWIFCLLLADLISMDTIIHATAWIIYFTVVKV